MGKMDALISQTKKQKGFFSLLSPVQGNWEEANVCAYDMDTVVGECTNPYVSMPSHMGACNVMYLPISLAQVQHSWLIRSRAYFFK